MSPRLSSRLLLVRSDAPSSFKLNVIMDAYPTVPCEFETVVLFPSALSFSLSSSQSSPYRLLSSGTWNVVLFIVPVGVLTGLTVGGTLYMPVYALYIGLAFGAAVSHGRRKGKMRTRLVFILLSFPRSLGADLPHPHRSQIVLPMGYIYSVSGYSVSVGYFNEVSSSSLSPILFLSFQASSLTSLLDAFPRLCMGICEYRCTKSLDETSMADSRLLSPSQDQL